MRKSDILCGVHFQDSSVGIITSVRHRKNVNDEETEILKQNNNQQQQQIQLQGEENNGTTPISHLQKRGSVNLLNDDDENDEYEWKIICWIDSKVRCN